MNISYRFLSDAIEFYQEKGYEYIEVPWAAHIDTVQLTTPDNREQIYVNYNDVLIGSGEQGFLQISNTLLSDSRYVTCTPCFRDEPIHDVWHRPYFMKVELFMPMDMEKLFCEYKEDWFQMVHDATQFFSNYVPVKLEKTGEFSCDIVTRDKEIELGSYGIREDNLEEEFGRWIYGTGCAEPRLSTAIRELNNVVII